MMTLRQARVGADMTQDTVAKKLGVHVNTYRRWEQRPEEMPMGYAIRFCEIVNTPLNFISFA